LTDPIPAANDYLRPPIPINRIVFARICWLSFDIDFELLDAGIAKYELKLNITLNEPNRSTVSILFSYLLL
jgi:hypothetical protein